MTKKTVLQENALEMEGFELGRPSLVCRWRLADRALPLENRKIYQIYQDCLSEMKIRKAIPIYSAAFLTSPVMDGLFLPRVYVPLPLISDCRENELRYILLHELQHYRRRDALVNYLMAAAGVLYWFNPVVWFAFK